MLKGLGVLKLHEIDEIDRAKMRGLAILLVKIAKRLKAEELARFNASKEICEKVG